MSEQFDMKNETTEFGPRKDTHSQKKKPKKSWKHELLSMLWQIGAIFLVLLAVRHFLFVPVSVEGESMEPTLHDHNRLLLNKVGKIERFDIVVFPAPYAADKQYIKRIIGIPGDTILMEEDQLYINDVLVDEIYLDNAKKGLEEWETYTSDFSLESVTGQAVVPDGSYFVLGDNRDNSKDSRVFGFISSDTVMGKTDWRLWPLKEFGRIDKED